MSLTVSVVINTVNRARYLRDCIIGVLALDYSAFEVVVVNGPSTDDTADILSEFDDRIKVATCDEFNLSVSRNIGIASSAAEIVAFIDDDAIPHPTWLARLVESYRLPKVWAVGGFTIDASGTRWQVRKGLCDRFGDAFGVSDFFDERVLNRPGSPYYPSLLGTNSSFRRSGLQAIGGFDDTFAYLLDETDVCLRIVDSGHHVVYEPAALVFHKGAASDRRSSDWVPKSLVASATSKAYFIFRHGGRDSPEAAGRKIIAFRDDISRSNIWLRDNGRISALHFRSLNGDLEDGLKIGVRRAFERAGRLKGDLVHGATSAFKPVLPNNSLRIVLISKAYPPRIDAGIARWTFMIACGLSKRGHQVHVITEATEADGETVRFEDGLWLHHVRPTDQGSEDVALSCAVPGHVAKWAARVWREVEKIKSFGRIVVSFPIWDLEGVACIGDPSIGLVMSLHTSYALAKPFKAEWNMRPIYEGLVVEKMIEAERRALLDTPVILANSEAIVDDLEKAYHVDFRDRTVVVRHGTFDICTGEAAEVEEPRLMRVLFVGRYEKRKGFDLAIEAAALVRRSQNVVFWFAGGRLSAEDEAAFDFACHGDNSLKSGVEFFGVVNREMLEDLYCRCDVVVMPSRYESFGLVAIEGMSAGKPIVGLAAGGLKEVITDGFDGFSIADSPLAAEQIAERLMQLANDRDLLRAMSANARASFARKYHVDIMVAGVEAVYRSALGLSVDQIEAPI